MTMLRLKSTLIKFNIVSVRFFSPFVCSETTTVHYLTVTGGEINRDLSAFQKLQTRAVLQKGSRHETGSTRFGPLENKHYA